MDNKKREFKRILTVVLLALSLFVFLFVWRAGFLPSIPTSFNKITAVEKSAEELDESKITGVLSQEKISNIAGFWTKDNDTFWVKGEYVFDPLTDRIRIEYTVSIRVKIPLNTQFSNDVIGREINKMLYSIMRTTLLGQNPDDLRGAPASITIKLIPFAGSPPVPGQDTAYIFPVTRYADILAETDPQNITAHAANISPLQLKIPNIGALPDAPQQGIPNK